MGTDARTAPARNREVLGAAASAALSTLGAVLALRLWKMSFDVPLSPGGDTDLALATVRTMQTSGWYLSTDLLGAPLGQDMRAYPGSAGDLWNLVALKLLSLCLSPAQTVNVAFLLGFPVIAAVTFWCLRTLRLRWATAVALGAVYAWLPYHFLHGQKHLFLSSYAVVPLACMVVLAVLTQRLEIGRGGWRRWVPAVSVMVLLGGTGIYYAVFAVVLVGSVGALAAIAARTWRPLLTAVALGAVSVAVAALAALPSLLYSWANGTSGVEGRSYAAVEFYGLKITGLITPVQDHRIPLFAAVRRLMTGTYIPGENMDALGLVGAAGFVVICVAALVLRPGDSQLLHRLRPLGIVTLTAVVWSTVAGLSGLLALIGFTQIRGWARMSVYIGFLAVAGAGMVLDRLVDRLGRGRRRLPALGPTLTALVTVAALLDQTTNAMVPDYSADKAAWTADATYFAQVQDELGTGAALFQLPLVPFPENPPVVKMNDYDHLRGLFHSDLRWSYGGIRGGDVEWQSAALSRGLATALPALVSVGFDAVYVNRDGYADGGAAVEAELVQTLGDVTPIVSADGLLAVYDLRDYAARLAAAGVTLPDPQTVLHPATLVYDDSVGAEQSDTTSSWRWAGATAHASITASGTQQVLLQGQIEVETPGSTVSVTVDGATTQLQADDGTVSLDLPLTVHDGSQLSITTTSDPSPTSGTDTSELRLKLVGLELTPTW